MPRERVKRLQKVGPARRQKRHCCWCRRHRRRKVLYTFVVDGQRDDSRARSDDGFEQNAR